MTQLGNLEEMILLLVLKFNEGEAYAVSIAAEYEKEMHKSISIPAVHTVLKRLETKKFIDSRLGEATQLRGGKKKRLYNVTQSGYEVLQEIQKSRSNLWAAVPKLKFD
ncbi:helix-turn-helix transcriptional regulator [Fulvivirga sp.]|uniref:helix-turn-helix transcriptional regulator n=1 Tax=Fulvivirga sp. TaxID=1931237 RepID=UPI0032ED361B